MELTDRSGAHVRATAAGRVNLVGDHTDYMGGLVLPMAIDLATTVDAVVGGRAVELRSDLEPDPASFALPVEGPGDVRPDWARYPAAVAAVFGATVGLTGTVTSTVPGGAGLSSSAALEVAVALALGAGTEPVELALACQRAEHAAVGVPSGVMDQLSICAGRRGTATLIDCASLELEHVRIPETASIWVVHSGQSRELVSSDYAERRRSAESARDLVGALPDADPVAIEAIADPLLRRRARHVRSECDRVRAVAAALGDGDLATAGAVMTDSHRSLRDDYEVSTAALDDLVERLCAQPAVHGARLTGAGFGGCAVALADAGIDVLAELGVATTGWLVTASEGISVTLD